MRVKLGLTMLLLSGLAACEDDPSTPGIDAGRPDAGFDAGLDADIDAGLDADIDAGPDADIDAGPDAGPDAGAGLTGTELVEPADFPRMGCEAGSLEGLDPTGVWHLDTSTDYGGGYVEKWNGAVKFAPGQGGVMTPRLDGAPGANLSATADDLIFRTIQSFAPDRLRIRGFDACKQNEDGSLEGTIVTCDDIFPTYNLPLCLVSTFRAVKVQLVDLFPSQGLSLLGEYRGDELTPWVGRALPVNVRAKDNVAYVVSHYDGLRLVDVTDPENMFELGHHFNEFGYNDVKLVDRADGRRFALVSNDYQGVDVIDVTDPTHPDLVTRFSEGGQVHTLFIESKDGHNRGYLSDYYYNFEENISDYELSVWDLDDPENPVFLSRFMLPENELGEGSYFHDMMVKDGIAYLNAWGRGFVWVDTNDPAAMIQLGQFDAYERRTSHSNWVTEVDGCLIAVHGDEDFGAHLRTIGVDSRPECAAQRGKQLGELSLRPEVSIHNIMAFGTTAYVAHYQDGVRLFDISDPSHPKLDRWFQTWNPDSSRVGLSFFEGAVGIDVDLAAGRIYVADIPRGLLVLSIDETE